LTTTSTQESSTADRGYARQATAWLLAVTLLAAPLFRAGQIPVALLTLELLAVAILVVVLWSPQRIRITRREGLALALLLVFPLPYLVPLPGELLQYLPGRERYANALSLLGEGASGGPVRLSLYPMRSESAWLVLLLPVAVFLGTRTLDPRILFKLVVLVVGMAAAQATLGLMQFGGGHGPLYLGMDTTHVGSAVGTYTNRNHLAGLLEMTLPVTLALLVFSIGRGKHGFARDWRGRVSFFASVRGHEAFVYGALTLLLVVGVIFTRSRSGIFLTMLGILITSIALSRRIGVDNVYGPTGTVTAVALGIGVFIGLAPVLNRFSEVEVLADSRLTIFSATLEGIGSFFPLGSGPGTYPEVFPAFQPIEIGRWFINHAHNDYLEWLFEGGLFAALLILLLLGIYAHHWTRVWARTKWTRFQFVQVGSGIGIFLMLLHTLVDYNLHIPANIVYFAFFAAVFFAEPDEQESRGHRRRRKRQTPSLKDAPKVDLPAPGEKPASATAVGVRNPFLD
jgi:O-antigen ligase